MLDKVNKKDINTELKTNFQMPFSSTFLDYPDKENIAVIAFVMGCDNNCYNCHNVNFQNPFYKKNCQILKIKEFIKKIKDYAKRCLTRKVVLSGGDPLFHKNINFIKAFLEQTKNELDICIYTGKNVDYCKENQLSGFKFLKTGKYEESLKQESKKDDHQMVFASKNQLLWDEHYNLLSSDGCYKF